MKRSWAMKKSEEGEEEFLLFFIFKYKFQSNSNIVSNILFKMRSFERFPKINFATFKTLLFSNSLLSFFSFTSKPFSNLFPKTIQTILNLDSNHSTK